MSRAAGLRASARLRASADASQRLMHAVRGAGGRGGLGGGGGGGHAKFAFEKNGREAVHPAFIKQELMMRGGGRVWVWIGREANEFEVHAAVAWLYQQQEALHYHVLSDQGDWGGGGGQQGSMTGGGVGGVALEHARLWKAVVKVTRARAHTHTYTRKKV